MTFAFATCAGHPGIDPDDTVLVAALAARGIPVEPVVWDAPGIDWARFAAVLVRNTWDYHRHRPRFLAWAERVDSLTTLLNPLSAIRWNTHKRYLRDLEKRGVSVVPTEWIDAGASCDLAALVASRGWGDASLVLKPAVSAGAEDTIRFDRDTLAGAAVLLEAIVAREAALVQPYLPSVETYGERSLVFFDGHFSHAVRKCPALGGDPSDKPERGLERAVAPTDAELDFAASVLRAAAAFAAPPLYARVDIAPDAGGRPNLMELEVVEPSLFFQQAPGSEERFAAILEQRLRTSHSSQRPSRRPSHP